MSESRTAQMLERQRPRRVWIRSTPPVPSHRGSHVAGARGRVCTRPNFGWRRRTMLSRYGASVADERARDEAHGLALGDSL